MLELQTYNIINIILFPVMHNTPYIIDWVDVALHTELDGAFGVSQFNRSSLLNWDTSRVLSMRFTFANSHYNQPLVTHMCWDTQNVTTMRCMFHASRYNHPLVTHICWDTRSLQDVSWMFAYSHYNHPLINCVRWDLQKLQHTERVFNGCNYTYPVPPEMQIP